MNFLFILGIKWNISHCKSSILPSQHHIDNLQNKDHNHTFPRVIPHLAMLHLLMLDFLVGHFLFSMQLFLFYKFLLYMVSIHIHFLFVIIVFFVVPAKTSKTTIVTTNAIRVTPFLFLYIFSHFTSHYFLFICYTISLGLNEILYHYLHNRALVYAKKTPAEPPKSKSPPLMINILAKAPIRTKSSSHALAILISYCSFVFSAAAI